MTDKISKGKYTITIAGEDMVQGFTSVDEIPKDIPTIESDLRPVADGNLNFEMTINRKARSEDEAIHEWFQEIIEYEKTKEKYRVPAVYYYQRDFVHEFQRVLFGKMGIDWANEKSRTVEIDYEEHILWLIKRWKDGFDKG